MAASTKLDVTDFFILVVLIIVTIQFGGLLFVFIIPIKFHSLFLMQPPFLSQLKPYVLCCFEF